MHQRTKEEAESRMEELERKTRQLEEETLTQKHLIHLEKLKTEKVGTLATCAKLIPHIPHSILHIPYFMHM